MAYSKDEPVAFMRLGPADDDVCTIIYDEKTTSIYAAFTREQARGEGVATALLDHALKSARVSGYEPMMTISLPDVRQASSALKAWPEAVAAALERGRARDLKETLAELLVELERDKNG